MSLCSRFAHAKKAMSTIFGGLFFIIILLMGFNLMVWGFAQYDSYNQALSKMSQNDQSAASENLVPANPGATNFNSAGSGSFNITVNNLGGTSVRIARIYITNVSPTGSSQCNSNPCIVDPRPGAATCVGSTVCYMTNGNIAVGEINHQIKVTGLLINDGSGYKVVLSSTRGRLYSFYYPWPASPTGGGGGTFVTNIGPLSIYFDFKSFNFTQGAQTSSQSAFCVPSGQTIVLWVKMVNQATDSDVKLEPNTLMMSEPYTTNGLGHYVRTWIVDPGSVNPSNVVGYNFNTNPYDLPAAGANGPGAPVIVKFGTTGGQGGAGGTSFSEQDTWLTFIGFYYLYRGQAQGETIPFMVMKDVAGYPGSC